MDTFPPNSRKAQQASPKPKRVEQVTSAEAKRRRPSLGKQFSATFIGGDARTATQYVVFNVILPAVKEMMVEAGSSGIERLVYGESRRKGPSPNPYGNVSYNRVSPAQRQQPVSRTLPQQARARHAFDEIIIPSRQEAEEVLDRLFDLISQYEAVTVADLYELTGIQAGHTDHKWGWTQLRGANVGRVRGGGYLLDLPDPEPLGTP